MEHRQLKDLAFLLRGVSYKPEELHNSLDRDAIALIKNNNINDDGTISLEKLVYVDRSKVAKDQILQKGDVIVCASGSDTLVGKAAQFFLEGEYTFGAFCKVIRPAFINKKFLGQYFISSKYRNEIALKAQGAIMKNLRNEHLLELLIPYYDPNDQEQIQNTLCDVFHIIQLRKQQLRVINELIKARFFEMFGDPDNNLKGWHTDTLGQYMTVLTDFSANGSYEVLDSNVIMRDECDYAIMVRTTDLEAGNLETGVKYIDQHAYELLGKSKLFGGELIMNKIGSAGKVYIMPNIDRPASLGRNAFMFRFDDRINMTFLYTLLTTKYGEKEIQQHVRGAVTKTITKDATRSIKILVPPIDLQEQFAAFVAQVNKSKAVVQMALDKTQLLFNSLMQQYFV